MKGGGSWGPSKGDYGDYGGKGRSAPYPSGGPPDMGESDCPLNEDGLPIRPDKEACLYYLNTGTCRSGTHCIFHHPPKADREEELNKSLSKSGMMPPPPGTVLPPVTPDIDGVSVAPPPVVVPPPAEPFAGASGTMSSQMAGIMEKLEALQQSSDGAGDGTEKKDGQPPLPSEGGPPVPGETASDAKKPAQPEPPKEVEYNEDGLPIRPGVQKCIQYLKAGKCTERNCRWDHPIGMGGVMNSTAFASMPGMIGGLMTEGALAMRPGRDQCPFLAKTNTCPFGPECRFDHSGGTGGSNTESASKPTTTPAPTPKKKDRGLGGTRGKRPPPRRY
jgi:hypothetical protein